MTARSEGIDELALPELERRMANGVRMGAVMAVDLANARVRVKSGDIETTWLPWSTGRASAAKRRWDPPEVGEQVVVLSPGGDLRQGVVLTGVFQDSAAAPSTSGDKDATVYSDGTVIEYDRASHTLLADLGSSKVKADRSEVLLQVGGVKISITAGGVAITGNLSINGVSGGASVTMNGDFAITGSSLTHNGKNIGSTHTHDDVVPGGGISGVPSS